MVLENFSQQRQRERTVNFFTSELINCTREDEYEFTMAREAIEIFAGGLQSMLQVVAHFSLTLPRSLLICFNYSDYQRYITINNVNLSDLLEDHTLRLSRVLSVTVIKVAIDYVEEVESDFGNMNIS